MVIRIKERMAVGARPGNKIAATSSSKSIGHHSGAGDGGDAAQPRNTPAATSSTSIGDISGPGDGGDAAGPAATAATSCSPPTHDCRLGGERSKNGYLNYGLHHVVPLELNVSTDVRSCISLRI